MNILQKPTFQKAYKKLHSNQKRAVDEAIRTVVSDPLCGESKIGDLTGVSVYKFKMVKQLTLLAYTYEDQTVVLTLLAIGTHKNFYRDLKKTSS